MALTKVNNRMIDGSYLNVKDFGAKGDGSTDDTDAIQDAINHASNNQIGTIFFPDGHYKYSVLRTYYDATDNPDFNNGSRGRDGRLQFRGTGRMSIADLNGMTSSNIGTKRQGALFRGHRSGINYRSNSAAWQQC